MNPRNWLVLGTLPIILGVTTPYWSSTRKWSTPATAVNPQDPTTTKKIDINRDELAGLTDIQDILELIDDRYVNSPNIELAINGGIQSALEKLHPFNSWLSISDLKEEDSGDASTGMTLVKRGIYATVLSVVPQGPADRAGIRPGEVIRRLNNQTLNNMSAWKMQRLMKGTNGTQLEVQRFPQDAVKAEKTILKLEVIPNNPISLQTSPRGTLISLPDLKIGRDKEFENILARLKSSQTLILDLRNNSEGSIEVARNIADLLCSQGTFAIVRPNNKPELNLVINSSGTRGSMKLIVLQDASTSGVAELLASALKRLGKAKILGSRTAGLGVALARVPLSQGGALELVSERWTGAGLEKLDQTGVNVDQPIKDFGSRERLLDFILDNLEASARGIKGS